MPLDFIILLIIRSKCDSKCFIPWENELREVSKKIETGEEQRWEDNFIERLWDSFIWSWHHDHIINCYFVPKKRI